MLSRRTCWGHRDIYGTYTETRAAEGTCVLRFLPTSQAGRNLSISDLVVGRFLGNGREGVTGAGHCVIPYALLEKGTRASLKPQAACC